MAPSFLSTLKNVFLSELETNGEFDATAPVDVLLSAHERISQLAAQIRLHADTAPYPQFACELRRIASEKQADVDNLKKRIETLGARTSQPTTLSISGKNHWQRMTRDLQGQKRLDDFLQQQEARVAEKDPEIVQLIGELKTRQIEHRKTLTRLVAVADPQANQT